MEPRAIVKKDRFQIIGMDCLTTKEDNKDNQVVADLWEKFKPRISEINNRTDNSTLLGIYKTRKNYPDRFSYIAGVEVDTIADIPKGMIPKIVKESKYAVFEHEGDFKEITETYEYIFEEWLPDSDYEKNIRGDNFETFKNNDEDKNLDNSNIEIYVAIK